MNEITGSPSALMTMDKNSDLPKAKNTLGKDDFMKLLMTQLRHQDPLKPMDHEQFAAQLAQFGSLEQLANIGSGIQGLKSGLGEGAKLQALGMIGKQVQASSSEIEVKQEGMTVTIPRPAPKGDLVPSKLSVIDGQGNLIREMDITGKNAGEPIEWDGKNQDGGPVAPGKYLYRVHGSDRNGQLREIGTELSGRVTGVEMDGPTPSLLVQTASGQTKIEWAKVRSVSLDESGSKPVAAAPVPASIPVAAKAEAAPAATGALPQGDRAFELPELTQRLSGLAPGVER
jgi:flagellar basal-body rod modification protein FlgD